MRPGVRRAAQRLAARGWDALDRLLEIRPGDPLAEQFAAFGANSRIGHPRRLITNPKAISIGSDVTINPGVVLEAVHDAHPLITIGDGSYFGFNVRIVAVNGVELDNGVAIGHGVTLADTIHDYKQAEPGEHAWQARLKVGRPLRIEEGAWIGNGTVIAGGITLGRGCIIGANCSVSRDVAPYTLIAGNPAQTLRQRDDSGEWHAVDDR
jgi:acetyltransferase-like isoleucine patch superfamily enzyme